MKELNYRLLERLSDAASIIGDASLTQIIFIVRQSVEFKNDSINGQLEVITSLMKYTAESIALKSIS